MQLPFSLNLSTPQLAAAFGSTSATYKFYWLIAVLESVENGNNSIKKRALFSRMIANAWYTVNYFKVSFGKQDLIQNAVQQLLHLENLTIDIGKDKLLAILENSNNLKTALILNHFNKNVPHWFLSPWFPKTKNENDSEYKKRIYGSSQNFDNNCLYALHDDLITINSDWIPYLQSNARILKDFCYWNLALFLQSRNPNVPDIPNKLIKPAIRGTLSNQRKKYWDIVFKELGTVNCIFTDTKLTIENFAIDHFVPHAFVSHDLIWNLIPIDKKFNSSKSDKLPSIEMHFDAFFEVQKSAYEIVSYHNPKSKLLEDFLTIYPVIKDANDFEYTRYKDCMQPLITIAHNNGFGYL
ncbi:HNH endonuclease domain-containing protein [Flavobacterium sp. TAB 87]|uniref:HNH endonuclease domain-containing protein n=1 Tax=Flavobacterium sp. TAB 87 TaxID=1729581 RepID=UPI00076C21E0|nr:HNH endonuclease domain-containing protein [Flavobacterium sp. TAB 87]KVV15001.1 hypothetical protein AP058_01559 [Flavobacterium sp. TAB 87]